MIFLLNDFSEIPLKVSYDSGMDDVLEDFYIPVLSKANQYDRITGFFSSASLAIAARGMEQFIINGGKMRLLTCPMLSHDDIRAIKQSVDTFDNIVLKKFISSYDEIEDKFQKDHVRALGWMLANGMLEIKIAVVKNGDDLCSAEEINQSAILHQKVGILYDQVGNIISFSGSNNETGKGWYGNTEEFKVFSSWECPMPYIENDIKKFNSFWTGSRKDVKVIDIPTAIKQKLIDDSKGFKPEQIRKPSKKTCNDCLDDYPKKEKLNLFDYQKEAIKKWNDNNRSLLFQMATGTGKTMVSIGCMEEILRDTVKPMIVIACPQVTLAAQWKYDNVDRFDIGVDYDIVVNGGVRGWIDKLNLAMCELSMGVYKNLIVYTTHSVCSKKTYIDLVSSFKDINMVLIGDECHGLGANKIKNALLESYIYRIGLSATPQRWFDEKGSDLILDYFGRDSFEFTIHDALINENPINHQNFLANYYYKPCFISLTDYEIDEYLRLTKKISKRSIFASDDDECLQLLKIARAKIEKNAHEKYEELERILDALGTEICNTIIFVSDAQIDNVIKMLGHRRIKCARFTKDQGTKPLEKYNGRSEREFIISKFKSKEYQVLVAIKCLDEGIDIPTADTAIIMASSTNPREYVQRIGRIIRNAPGKTRATIYDMILKPEPYRFDDEKIRKAEIRVFKKEMDRALELSKNSIENGKIVNIMYDILEEVGE